MPPLTPPPDPNPRTPKLRCPPGSVDCQIHLFGPATEYPFDPGSKYISADMLPEESIRIQDILGLDHAVIVSGGGYGMDTRHLCDTLRRFPDRFRGVALLPGDTTQAEMERLQGLGVRGTRFVAPRHGLHLPQISERVAAIAAELGWVIQFYPGRGELEEFADRLLALPGRIVLDHFAALDARSGTDQPAFRALLRMLDSGRVWVRLSGPMRCTQEEFPYPSVTPIARALVAHAPERMVWGSDWPHVNMQGRVMPNDGDLLDLLLDWAPDEAVRNRILSDQARALYDFPAPSCAKASEG
ncbi:amidohydrolase family protein [Plastoroseomonas hellenica]|uniref:amidohydrolase family protein n=1 Tax=Plastoroseomonas hellenica TaxID=2687306 RepID=UPI001BAB1BA2|nr:amidohydrolase family protein [Plastoroseomonas hellenica]MBR0642518.1 amidohydrolase family protein [Plastoroseomonas hellenica]